MESSACCTWRRSLSFSSSNSLIRRRRLGSARSDSREGLWVCLSGSLEDEGWEEDEFTRGNRWVGRELDATFECWAGGLVGTRIELRIAMGGMDEADGVELKMIGDEVIADEWFAELGAEVIVCPSRKTRWRCCIVFGVCLCVCFLHVKKKPSRSLQRHISQ